MSYAILVLAALAGAVPTTQPHAMPDAPPKAAAAPPTPAKPATAPSKVPAGVGLPLLRHAWVAHHTARKIHRARFHAAGEGPVIIANTAALLEPQSQGFVNAVQIYPWNDGVLYRLLAAPGRVTDVALQAGETIVSVAAGDTVRWTVGDTTSGSGDTKRVHVLVKPFAAGLSTNLIITTDRRTYHLQMASTPATAMAALSWSYPQDDLIAIQHKQAEVRAAAPLATGLSVDSLNFGYTITGENPPWRPLRAFDDGRQTFIEFPATITVGEAPPLFVLGEKGDAQLVNYRMAGRFYIVDRLFSTAELRLGAKKQIMVRITRKPGAAIRQDDRRAS